MNQRKKHGAKKRRDLSGGRGKEAAEEFNRKHPVGSPVWYWQTLTFGPVLETTVREPAYVIPPGQSNAGMPVAFLAGKAGYVCIFHVTEVREDQRAHVKFVTPGTSAESDERRGIERFPVVEHPHGRPADGAHAAADWED